MRDARAALDALREEERERRRREAEEAERIRQIQMREKLEVMRQKKQEYLQYQRQVLVLNHPGVFFPRQRLAGESVVPFGENLYILGRQDGAW